MSSAPQAPPGDVVLSVPRIYDAPSIDGFDFSFVSWSPDGNLMTYIKSSADSNQLWAFDIADGTTRMLFDFATLNPQHQEKAHANVNSQGPKLRDANLPPWRLRLVRNKFQQSYEWSPDGKWILAGPCTGPVYLLDPVTGKTLQLTSFPPGWITDFKFSPDSKCVSFVAAFQLYLVDLATHVTRVLTPNGSEGLRYATPDESNELLTGTGHWWSPDAQQIACLVTSESQVFQYPLQNLLVPEATVQPMRYVMPGMPGVVSAIQVLSPSGAIWIDTSRWSGWYIAAVRWLPDSRHIAIEMLSREQKQLALVIADSATGQVVPILNETDPAWINVCNDLHFLSDGTRFLWSSEKDSWRQLYLYSANHPPVQLTRGEEAVLSVEGVDETNSTIYYLTSPAPYTDLQLKSVTFHSDDTGIRVDPPVSLTTDPGTHAVTMSPDFLRFADQLSSVNEPPCLLVRQIGGATTAAESNAAGRATAAKLPQFTFVTVNAAKTGNPTDTMPLLGRLLPPANMVPGQRYPVVVYVYGGPIPDACGLDRVVVNYWQRVPDLWLRLLAQHGIGVFSVDNRGANAAPRGHSFETPIYGRLGEIELQDQLAGVAWLKQQVPWADTDRMAIVGGSFGGFMTLNLLLSAPNVFQCGAAFAPVTNWLEFDALYTERYMGTPASNPDGYTRCSVINRAEDIDAPRELLMIHGTSDTSVHFTHSIQMLDAFQKANRQCQLMVYPGENHDGFFNFGNRPAELFLWMTNFLLGHLSSAGGERPQPPAASAP